MKRISRTAIPVAVLAVAVRAQCVNFRDPFTPPVPDGRPNLSGPGPKALEGTGQTVRVNITLQDDTRLGTLGDGGRFSQLKREAPPAGPAPRMPDGKPDFSGFWVRGDLSHEAEPAQLLPWSEAVVKERIANNLRDSPNARCLPSGPLQTAAQGKFVQTPTLLVILNEFLGNFRHVFLDGRSHPKDLNPTWVGHSIGHWEGDTPLVDTAGFNDKSWLTMIRNPYPHTEMMHVVEPIGGRTWATWNWR